MKKVKSFKNSKHNGIQLKFPNGNWISTIWGAGSYTENHDYTESKIPFGYETFLESDDVEIMVDCPEKLSKKIHKKYDGDGSVIGHLTITQWLEILNLLAKSSK